MDINGVQRKQKILVVGSHPAVVISLRTMLVEASHVLTTDDSKVAIRLAQTKHADIALALIDVCTIDMDPRLLAERLRTERPGMKILFFSSLVDGQVIRLGIIDPNGGVLRKEGVVQAIEEALHGSEPAKPLKTLTAGSSFDHLAF